MAKIRRCPKCDARFDPPREEVSECPRCGIWFYKWDAPPPAVDLPAEQAPEPEFYEEKSPAPLTYWGRALALVLIAVWGARLAAMDYRAGEIGGSFMHAILLPIHEAGHVFFIPLGEFMTILGGSLFQVALPLAIGTAFLLRQRDAFGAAVCVWWAGTSMVDLSPYVWDALNPQLVLIGGHTGEDGPHDWIYLLTRLGSLNHAHGWGVTMHHLGVILMGVGILWGARVLWRRRPENFRRTP